MKIIEKIRQKKQIVRAVLYARFSSDNQREESIDANIHISGFRVCLMKMKIGIVERILKYIMQFKITNRIQQKYWQKYEKYQDTVDYKYWQNNGWLQENCNFYISHRALGAYLGINGIPDKWIHDVEIADVVSQQMKC